MKKVVYTVSRYRKDEIEKFSGLGFITETDLIIACISKQGKPYVRVFDDAVKHCYPLMGKDHEYQGAHSEIREIQIDTGKDNYETREIELEYKIWFKLVD